MISKDKTKRTSGARGQSILLVDDDSSVREMVGRVLSAEGYQVLTAVNGVQALGIVAANNIDLVLLDLNMPGQGGWDTFKKLTSIDPSLAVLIITARPNQLFTALGTGVGGLLEKPLDFPILLRTVSALLTESTGLRLARMTGHQADFHFLPSTGAQLRE